MRQNMSFSIRVALTCMLLVLISFSYGFGQDMFVDDFEDGNADGWELGLNGNYAISTVHAHSGQNSVQLLVDEIGGTHIVRSGFTAAEGVYETWMYIEGSHEAKVGELGFHANGIDDFYMIQCKPVEEPDNGIYLWRKVGASTELLAEVTLPTLHADQWFKLTACRYLSPPRYGAIDIFINDKLIISVIDTGLTAEGSFTVGGHHEVFVDDIRYDKANASVPSLSPYAYAILALMILITAVVIFKRRITA